MRRPCHSLAAAALPLTRRITAGLNAAARLSRAFHRKLWWVPPFCDEWRDATGPPFAGRMVAAFHDGCRIPNDFAALLVLHDEATDMDLYTSHIRSATVLQLVSKVGMTRAFVAVFSRQVVTLSAASIATGNL